MVRPGAGLARWLRVALAHRFMPAGVVLLAVALTLPAIDKGLWWDDLVHRVVLVERVDASGPVTRSPLVAARFLFAFIEPTFTPRLMDVGFFPWWTLPGLQITFWRPLTALTHWADYRLWPDASRAMHLHSIAWYALVCLAAALAYRRLLGLTWVGGVAALLFAVDAAHADLVAWVASRNALVAAAFGLLALIAHDRWRRDGWRYCAVVGPLGLALSVLSAEAGIATLAYIAAHAVFLDSGRVRQRVLALLPYAVIGLVWRLVYRSLGYGTWGSEIYVDPGREPGRFAAAVLDRGPILLLGQLGGPDLMAFNFLSTSARRALWLAGILLIIVLGGLLAALLRRDRVARFWAAGTLLAVLPAVGAGVTSGRLLVFVGFGAMGLVASFARGVIERVEWAAGGWRALAMRALCLALLALHLVWSPLQLAAESWRPGPASGRLDPLTDLGTPPRDQRAEVLVLNAPSPFHFLYGPSARRARGEPEPPRTRLLAPGYDSLEVTGVDPHSLDLRPALGYLAPPEGGNWPAPPASEWARSAFFYRQLDGIFRSRAHPFRLGQHIVLTGMSVEVTALTPDRRPQQVRMRFAQALDDPALRWLVWDWASSAYRVFTPPRVGETVRIPGPF